MPSAREGPTLSAFEHQGVGGAHPISFGHYDEPKKLRYAINSICLISADGGHEAEADYIGVYHAARAGFDVAGAAAIWRRMGANHPAAIHLEGSTHPSTAKRFLAIEAAAAEVARKQASGLPLIPEEREGADQ